MTIYFLIIVGVPVGNEWSYYVNKVIKLEDVIVVISKNRDHGLL